MKPKTVKGRSPRRMPYVVPTFDLVRSTPLLLVLVGIETRNSSGDEIASVNFLYDDVVHALKMQ